MTPSIESAARWLVEKHEQQQPRIIPTLCRQFGLSAVDAIAAIREANRLRMVARTEGGE
jgi:hypothetical protein